MQFSLSSHGKSHLQYFTFWQIGGEFRQLHWYILVQSACAPLRVKFMLSFLSKCCMFSYNSNHMNSYTNTPKRKIVFLGDQVVFYMQL